MKKQLVHAQDYTALGMPGSRGFSASCIRAGNYVYITGQTAFTLDGELIGVGDPAAQARQAMENIKVLIEKAGGTLADVVKITVYVTDRALRAAAYPVIRSYFPDVWPCGTGFVIKGLAREELLVEIDAWGFIDDERARKQLIRARDVSDLGVPGSAGMAAQCIRAGNMVYLQGQVGWTLDGGLVGAGDPAAQARQAMDNITTLMEMAGGSIADVTRTIYAVPEREYRRNVYPEIYGYFDGPIPTGTGLVVEGLASEDLLIEVDPWGWIDSPEARKQPIRSHDLGPAGMLGSRGRALQALRAGNWVFLQGQVGWTLDSELVGIGDPAAQARQAMDNIKTLMEMAGGKLSDVVRVIVYVTDRDVRHAAYPVIQEYVGDLWPCGSGIVVKGLARPDLLVEIDAYGFIDDPE
jgi:enamine deaminase RidA (YjgF/YER057c/UK114 family)